MPVNCKAVRLCNAATDGAATDRAAAAADGAGDSEATQGGFCSV